MAILGGFPSGYPFEHVVYFQTLVQITTQPPLNPCTLVQKVTRQLFQAVRTLLMQHKHKQFKAL